MSARTALLALVAASATALVTTAAPPTMSAPALAHPRGCDADRVALDDVEGGEHWAPLTPSKWAFPGDQIILTEKGTAPTGPRRPFEYATLTTGPELGSLRYDAEVRLDEPTSVNNRDVVLIWNYQSPTRFYYAHISQDNTIYPHNGIFVVNDADRLRIDDQWNGSVGAPPAVDDLDWHHVSVRYDAETGAIAVHVDGAEEPLMTATDTTFSGGRVGFGSFDNFGRARDIGVTGSPVLPAAGLWVSAPPVARAGRKATVRVAGLAPCESFSVRLDGDEVAEGVAPRRGPARVRMALPAVRRPTAVTIGVVGSEADRAGSDRMWVLPGR
jgi:hypothetical protein